ncbi:MAG: glycosyltransferase family 4 protein [Gammaproteobacteria bacterium]|nr:glycosyltransferase family 4 protein [Gammaproteobacteria bacterium]
MLKIALIRQRYAGDGGAERFVARMLDTLKDRARLTLITREWDRVQGFEVLACNPFYLGRWWRDWSFARGVCRLVETRRFDLVQSHERIACCDLYRAGDGLHREWLKNRARVLGPLGRLGLALNPYHRYVLAAEERLFRSPRLRAVVCNSRMVRDEVKRHFALPDEKLHVIYSGVDTGVYHPDLKRERAAARASLGFVSAAPLFLFVGSGFERKGLASALRALAQLQAAQLLVIGRDRHAAHYQALAQKLGLGERTQFLGAIDDVRPYYGAADALVLPTLYDPFPNVALEAMACGVPVITSTTSGAAELIENGRNGYVCDALDIESLAAHLRAAIEPARHAALCEQARRTVEPLTLESASQRWLDLYASLTR